MFNRLIGNKLTSLTGMAAGTSILNTGSTGDHTIDLIKQIAGILVMIWGLFSKDPGK